MANKMYDLGYLQNFDQTAIADGRGEPDPEPAAPVVRPEPRVLAAVADAA